MLVTNLLLKFGYDLGPLIELDFNKGAYGVSQK